LAVLVDEDTQVPQSHVQDGQIVLNLSPGAVRNLQIDKDFISCSGRFNGVSCDLLVPIKAVAGIFSKENGCGLMFQAGGSSSVPPPSGDGTTPEEGGKNKIRPKLRVVK
jgi:stringent starvation protein B